MATSGTTGQTVFTTRQVIEHANRHCKFPPQVLTAEWVQHCLETLWTMLMDMASEGIPVWKIQTVVVPLVQAQYLVTMPVGTVEVLKANIRDLQPLSGTYSTDAGGTVDNAFDEDILTQCTQTSANGSLTVEYDSPVQITSVGLLPGASGTWDYVYEVSQDGVTYSTVATFTDQEVVDREWLWTDLEITAFPSYSYFRLRATDGTTLGVRELYVANTPTAINMAPLNKDDYFTLPNKTFQGRPVQYWQNLVRDRPVLNLWPVPDEASNFRQLEVQTHQLIMDVGTLVQELDLPRRWFSAITWLLAERLAIDNPEFKGDLKAIQGMASRLRALAWGGIAADGPIYIQPDISYYTR